MHENNFANFYIDETSSQYMYTFMSFEKMIPY